MPLEEWIILTIYLILGCLVVLPSPVATARPRFDTSTDMGLVLVPADAEIDSVIFRLRATDQDADFPLIFDITATVTPIVRIENLPCTLYNKVCQANVILTKRLVPGRLHDFAVRVKDSKGDSNSMQATISVTNATTQRDKIFPHIPAIIMVPEDTKPGKELDYVLVRSNQWSGKPVYIELWQPKELFTIRQRQTPAETRGVITLIGELDFETQSMYTLKMYATDPYTEPKKDTRNIAGLHLVVIVQDVQDVPPIFTLAPPLTKINNTVQPGDLILRVHAEDGDKGVPREVTYGLVSEGNPFTPFFNISETTGEIILARPLEELTQITHVGAPVVLSVVAEEIRRSTSEPPAQATVVEVGLLLGEPGNSPPFFESDNYVAWMDENAEPGSMVMFTEPYSTRVRDEDIGKAGVFALKLYNNNGTFEINPTVAERTANFIITVRDNSLIDYEMYKSLRFEIIAQEVGPATNLSATVPATIFIRDVNDNPPVFDSPTYEVTLSEDVTAGTRVVQVHATDKDTGSFGRIQYTQIIGPGNEGFVIDPNTGIITVAMGNSILDREITASLQLSVEARDDDGKGLRGIVPLIVNLLDVNDNAPIFERESYELTLNEDSTNFTVPAIIKAFDADAEPPNNEIRYELVHGNYENKFYLNEMTGELFLREPINKIRRTRHNTYQNFATKVRNGFVKVQKTLENMLPSSVAEPEVDQSVENSTSENSDKMNNFTSETSETLIVRKKRENDDVIFTLTARAYDLGVPHLSGLTQVNVMKGPVAGARIVSFVVKGENPNPVKTAETLAAITGGRITVLEIRPYTIKDAPNGTNVPNLENEKKSIVVARVEPNNGGTSLVDIEKIRAALAANGVGVIGGDMSNMGTGSPPKSSDGDTSHNTNTNTNTNTNITRVYSEEVTVYKAENRLLFWLLIILGLLMLLALIALIICCICPGCPFYMAPRKRRVHSSETLIARSDGRPKRHLYRKHARLLEASWPDRKQAWSADPMRRNWQFNRRNQKAVGLASLPGDVRVIDREHEILDKTGSLRLRDGPVTVYSTVQQRGPDDERIYIEDVEGIRAARDYADMDHYRHHDPERGFEMSHHQSYVNQDEQRAQEQAKFIREQHFYRDGNAEILRLVTRGQIDEGTIGHPAKRPHTLVMEHEQSGAYRNDGKEILLQRFIEDQKHRHATGGQDLHDSFQDIERRSMESHHRQKDPINIQAQQQQKILLIPERLEDDNRQHIEELGPEVQRLIIDHGTFDQASKFETKDSQERISGPTLIVHPPITKVSSEKLKDETSRQSVNLQRYSIHDLELARQNALLTRLLLERDAREVGAGAMVDSASYLETQSLPGQVAIATQTDRTAATQTELPNRSRSDNDESEEDARIRKKLKSKKRYGDAEPRRMRTLCIKSPIEEEETQYSADKRTIILRKKMRDLKDSRRISLEPEVLREISDSLDENVEPPINVRREDEEREDSNSKGSRNEEENVRLDDSSSMELILRDDRRIVLEKGETRNIVDVDSKKKSHRVVRENNVEPSFRILEKELSSLSKKISKLTGKKILQSSNGSETDSHEIAKTITKSTKKIDKKTEIVDVKKVTKETETTKTKRSKSTPRARMSEIPLAKEQTKIREEIVDEKTRKTLNYRKGQNMSTGSSDLDETVEKVKKPILMVTHAERQRQLPVKSSYVKLKRHGRVEQKEMPKSAIHATPQEIGVVKDTSDSASKGSIKSCKSERDTMRMKRYGAGTVEGQSSQASGSSSSDNVKDKRGQRKERPILEKKSVVEASDEKTETEHPNDALSLNNTKDKRRSRKEIAVLNRKSGIEASDSLSSDNLIDKTPGIKERPILEKKTFVESSVGETETEHLGDVSNSENFQAKTSRKKERLLLDGQSPVEDSGGKTGVEHPEEASDRSSSNDLHDEKRQRTEVLVRDRKSAVEISDAQTSNNLKDERAERKKSPILEVKSTAESKEEKTEFKKVSDAPYSDDLKDKTSGTKESAILDIKSDVEVSQEKTDIEQTNDPLKLNDLKDTILQRDETSILDTKSPVETNQEKTDTEQTSDVLKSNDSKDKILRTKGTPILEEKSAVDASRENANIEQTSDHLKSDDSKDKTVQKKETSILDTKSAVEASERKTESESHSEAANSDNLKDKIPRQQEILILDKESIVEASETPSKVSQEKSSKASPEKSNEKSSPVPTVIEIKRESPEITESRSIVPVTVAMQKNDSTEKHEKVIDERTAIKKSDDSEKNETSDTIEHEVLTIPKEQMLDFLTHEMKDSMQNLEGHYYSITEGAEIIKNIVVGSVTMKNGEEETSSVSEKQVISVPVKLDNFDNFEEWFEAPMDTSETVEKVDEEKKVIQRTEDGGTFSDNFDSFCGTDKLSKDTQGSKDSQGPKDEIAYEPLRSQSSEEEISADSVTYVKDNSEISEDAKVTEVPAEKSASPQITTIEETQEPQKSISSPITSSSRTDGSTDTSPKKTVSRSPTPVPLEVIMTETRPEVMTETRPEVTTDDSTHTAEIKLASNLVTEEPIDTSESTIEATKAPGIEQPDFNAVEKKFDQVPIVPPLDLSISDEKIIEIKESSKQTPVTSPKLSSQIPDEITLETPTQKEFGIADSLFVDAKLLKSPKKVVSEIEVEVPPEERIEKDKIKINDVPPINLAELSRAMLDDADDSDSSEASTKTMLTARPYGTPRHRRTSGSADAKPVEVPLVSIEIAPDTGEARESPRSPGKIDKKASPDGPPEILMKPELQTEVKPDTSGEIVEETIAPKDKAILKILPEDISRETPKQEVGTGHDEDIKKLVAAVQEENGKEETAEKVQLYQIGQETLPADPDGFASLPETGDTVKSFDDTTFPEVTPLPEETKKLPEKITNEDVDEHVAKTSNTDGVVPPPKIDNTEKSLIDIILSQERPLSEQTKKLPEKITNEDVDEHVAKTSNTDGVVPPPKIDNTEKSLINIILSQETPLSEQTKKLPEKITNEDVDEHVAKTSNTDGVVPPPKIDNTEKSLINIILSQETPLSEQTKKLPEKITNEDVDEHVAKTSNTDGVVPPPKIDNTEKSLINIILSQETPLSEQTKKLPEKITNEDVDEHVAKTSNTDGVVPPPKIDNTEKSLINIILSQETPLSEQTKKLPEKITNEDVDEHVAKTSNTDGVVPPPKIDNTEKSLINIILSQETPLSEQTKKLPEKITNEDVDEHVAKTSNTDGVVPPPKIDNTEKSLINIILSQETPLSEQTKKLPEKITNEDVDEHVAKTSNTDGVVPPPKIDNTEKSLDNEIFSQKTPLSEQTKKYPVDIAKDKHAMKGLDDETKIVPHTKKETKVLGKKRDASKEDLTKGVRKIIAATTKPGSPKKERKVRTLKDESTKITKQTTVVGQIARSRDSKRQVRPPERPQAEEQANLRPDRIRHTWRKTDHPDKDVQQKEKTKVEKVKKISNAEGEKNIAKRPSEIRAKREKVKDSRARKIQEKGGKTESGKIIPLSTVEKVFGKEEHDVEDSVRSADEEMEKSSVIEFEKPMTPRSIANFEKTDGDEKGSEEKLSLESSLLPSEDTELLKDARLDAPSSLERTIDIETTKSLPTDTRKQDAATSEKIEPTVISEPMKKIEEPVATEMIAQPMDLVSTDGEIELKNADHQHETKKEMKQELDEDSEINLVEDKSQKISSSPRKTGKPRRETEMVAIESQSRYMEWYKLKREEMERKRQDRKDGDEEEEKPKWLRKSTRQRWIKVGPDEKRMFDSKMTEMTPSRRRKIKPLVNVESEQLKAIVRQGRKLRRAQGEKADEPQIQIFAPEKPPTPLSSIPVSSRYHHHHHLVQHSEYKYEKMPLTPFYLHPPSAPNSTSQISPQHYEDMCHEQYSSIPNDSRSTNELYDSVIIHQPQQVGNKLRHGQLLEKKSVFDIAYSEAAPSQLRSDSTTPPS